MDENRKLIDELDDILYNLLTVDSYPNVIDDIISLFKPTSISETELKLNQARKMSNDYRKHSENTIKAWKLTENELTEANKQIKEREDDINNLKDCLGSAITGLEWWCDEYPDTDQKAGDENIEIFKELLSKLNKD